MYQIRVINKDGSTETIYNTKSYDRALNKFVKVVTIQEDIPLLKGECIKVEIRDEKGTYLTHFLRGQEKEKENGSKSGKKTRI